jgi:hypothetical protein
VLARAGSKLARGGLEEYLQKNSCLPGETGILPTNCDVLDTQVRSSCQVTVHDSSEGATAGGSLIPRGICDAGNPRARVANAKAAAALKPVMALMMDENM